MADEVIVVLDCPDCGFYEEMERPASAFDGATYSVPCAECGKMIVPEVEDEGG